MKFKKDVEPMQSSDGFWYDITDGGYLKPEMFLYSKKDIKAVQDALDLLQLFKDELIEAELYIEG